MIRAYHRYTTNKPHTQAPAGFLAAVRERCYDVMDETNTQVRMQAPIHPSIYSIPSCVSFFFFLFFKKHRFRIPQGLKQPYLTKTRQQQDISLILNALARLRDTASASPSIPHTLSSPALEARREEEATEAVVVELLHRLLHDFPPPTPPPSASSSSSQQLTPQVRVFVRVHCFFWLSSIPSFSYIYIYTTHPRMHDTPHLNPFNPGMKNPPTPLTPNPYIIRAWPPSSTPPAGSSPRRRPPRCPSRRWSTSAASTAP